MGFPGICFVFQFFVHKLRGGFPHVCEPMFYFPFSYGGKVTVYVAAYTIQERKKKFIFKSLTVNFNF